MTSGHTPEFRKRLAKNLVDHKDVLDRLAQTDGGVDVASDAPGTPLWRFTHVHDECDPAEGECYATYEEYADEGGEPGTWHALDAASVAARREAVAAACIQGANAQLDDPSRPWQAFAADAVLKALGLGGDS